MKFFKIIVVLVLLFQGTFAGLEVPPVDKEAIESAPLPLETASQKSPPQKVTLYKKDRRPSTEATIAAVVNGTPISVKDLQNKLKLVLKVPMEKLSAAEKDQIMRQILNVLIDELLKIQTTESLGLKVDPKEIEENIHHIEKQNNLPKNGFRKMLKDKNIPEHILVNSIKADVLWRQYISAWAGNSLEVNKKELKEIVNPALPNDIQYHLAEIEIYTPPDDPDGRGYAMITQIQNALKAKKPFMMVAHSASHAPSAARGGDIGWINHDMLDSETLDIVQQLTPGQLTAPIKTEQGYRILLLIDKKDTGALQPTLTARQIEIKIPEAISRDAKALEEKIEKLNNLVKTLTTCSDFDQLTDQIPDAQIHVYKNLQLRDLSPDLQSVLKDLETGVPSRAIFNSANNTIVFFLVCERGETPVEKTKSVEGMANQISNQRFMAISEQKLKEAKRVASIEIRI
jgi:peptidyl-prolyl cis-trans isomerase SurA